jgi:deoxyribodipyrimidine photo-lyase
VLTKDGAPFVVFTPYRNAWLAKLDDFQVKAYPVERHAGALARPVKPAALPALEALGFERSNLEAIGVPPGHGRGARVARGFSWPHGELPEGARLPPR